MDNKQIGEIKSIKFFTAFFCPFAQQIQISFNEVGEFVLNKIEKIQAFLSIDENGVTIVHPELVALGRNQVPTLYYKDEVLKESKDLIRFIDKELAEKQYTLFPAEEKLRNYSFFIEDYIRDNFISTFYAVFNAFDKDILENSKMKLLQYIFNIIQGYKGPFYLGETFCSIDITIAPYLLRMFVLEKLKDFIVPQTEEYSKWFEWKENLVKRKSIADSIEDEVKILEAYKKFLKRSENKYKDQQKS